jgi:hypothetical protein
MSDIIIPPKKKKVSFSQYSKWLKCPFQYNLDYIKGFRKTDLSLHLFFGTAMHVAVQTYLETLYSKSKEEANSLDLNELFRATFKKEVEKEASKYDLLTEEEKKTVTKFTYLQEDYDSFLVDGSNILDTFLNPFTKNKYFPAHKFEFVGVELPLDAEILNNISFIAYVDLVVKDKETGNHKIYDFKTSTLGWNSYTKQDESKYSQILLYKAFYSKKFNIPLNKIDVEFFILKRKLYENVSFPQSRIQTFEPPSNNSAVAEAIQGFTQFVEECFTKEGEYNTTAKFLKIPGKNKKNCKYCPHLKVNCDGVADPIL